MKRNNPGEYRAIKMREFALSDAEGYARYKDKHTPRRMYRIQTDSLLISLIK